MTGRTRTWPAVLIALIGAALLAAPFGMQMFHRAPKGAVMLHDFKPFMTEQRLTGFQDDLQQIDAAVTEINAKAPAAGVKSADYDDFAKQWPQVHATMTGLMGEVHGNLGNYQAVAGLPSFTLFPWFFVGPGVLMLGLAAFLLRARRSVRGGVIALVVLGLGLALAPVGFGMFSKAPQGGQMMDAFKTIETTDNVARIQGYFGTMAIGQGAIRLHVVPALQAKGVAVAQDFPATTALDEGWVHILNDMTPMIGAMSDNVTNYQALTALPPFPLFPWFFFVPGLLVAGLALAVPRTSGAP